MAQIGTAQVAEGNGTPITTSNVTSTASSLVVGGCATYDPATPRNPTLTSSLAGTYTEAGDVTVNVGSDRIVYGLTYNLGGTRGAGHNFSETAQGGNHRSVSFSEFDSVAASPTVTVGSTAAGTSTAPSCSVTVPSGTATVVAIMVYGGASTTATVSDGNQVAEADENSDSQAHFIAAKYGQSGTVTITWALAASRQWSCYAVAFSETGGGGGGEVSTIPPVIKLVRQTQNQGARRPA